ncbi:galactoside alpha-(1,2)-fucosyltransferase 2-like [Rhincodon typus]|uniref:galactoside alpha-(1,2)-fucosyltransferase 2-like n=1 Tax=Rhincodon typus TaxID=259920 RepID=UPI00202EB8B8|nr:galactoside alpha-(1,2)-fucosyltransferase 2-like [Rhincodon typus]XP_048470625.1 galactoside alpha-(1,2)-fucosyltransferase 2-like [Rhincodon typus]XP_048470626.1 galactoside alpha-(1,2)-fucosyltransferase 2-like [Rhincodon typus]XP_048470627.1 galactoside alpha-(1,2)-fucosyltransferase 2-like [Rhincodon typus]
MVRLMEVCAWPVMKVLAFVSLFLFIMTVSTMYKYQLKYDLIFKYFQAFENATTTLECGTENGSEKAMISSKGFWTINSIGRLGNQMGEYATLYALAKLNGHQAYILPSMANYLSPIFKITLPTLHGSVGERIKWKNYYLHDWMEDSYRSIQGDYVRLSGYTCSWTFYHHIRSEILREFTLHDFIVEQTDVFLRRIRGERKNVTYVGVHVRRGDYIHVMPNAWKGVIADKKYLDTAMAYFRNKYKNVVFAVTSNGMDWCKQNINNSKGDVYFSDDPKQATVAFDFSILAHCNHTIMTIGTFGFWAGYLAGGETIYLTNFTLPESQFLKVFKYEAAFLPQWIGIPADLSPLLHKDASKLVH